MLTLERKKYVTIVAAADMFVKVNRLYFSRAFFLNVRKIPAVANPSIAVEIIKNPKWYHITTEKNFVNESSSASSASDRKKTAKIFRSKNFFKTDLVKRSNYQFNSLKVFIKYRMCKEKNGIILTKKVQFNMKYKNTLIRLCQLIVSLSLLWGCSDESIKKNEHDGIVDCKIDLIFDEDVTESLDEDYVPPVKPLMIANKQEGISESFLPRYFTKFKHGTVLFSATTSNEGEEIWRSDGTFKGTYLVKDLNPGPWSSNPHGFVNMDSYALFSAELRSVGTVVWKSDGTASGTHPLTTEDGNVIFADLIVHDDGNYVEKDIFNYARDGSNLFFITNNEEGEKSLILVNNEGDSVQVLDSFPEISNVVGLFEGSVSFIARNRSKSWKLWKNNGTVDGTELVFDFNQNSGKVTNQISHQFFGRLFIKIHIEDFENDFHLSRLIISDGTESGTKILKEGVYYHESRSASNGVYFSNKDSGLTFSDGSIENTYSIDVSTLLKLKKRLYDFQVLDDKTLLLLISDYRNSVSSYELLSFDLASRKATLLHDFINDGEPTLVELNGEWFISDSELIDNYNETDMYFDFIYKINTKTGEKTKIDKVVNFAWEGSDISIFNVVVVGGRMWFSGNAVSDNDVSVGYEPFVSDGTYSGTRFIGDFNRDNEYATNEFFPISFGENIYFLHAFEGFYSGRESYLARPNIPESSGFKRVEPEVFMRFNVHSLYSDRLLLSYYDSDQNKSLSVIDYRKDTVEKIHDKWVNELTTIRKGVLFYTEGESDVPDLCITDGTKEGIQVLKHGDPQTPREYYYIMKILSDGDIALFFHPQGELYNELWMTDGTVENTIMLLGELPQHVDIPHDTFVCGDKFLLSAEYLYYGNNYTATAIVSDATREGTHEIFRCSESNNCEKINLGCAGGVPLLLAQKFNPRRTTISVIEGDGNTKEVIFDSFDTMVDKESEYVSMGSSFYHYFTLYTKEYGYELWRTDGTKNGTSMVKDISPGIESSSPKLLAVIDKTLYFNASDGVSGYELWKTEGDSETTEMVIDIFKGSRSTSIEEIAVIDSGIVVNGTGLTGLNQLWYIPLID